MPVVNNTIKLLEYYANLLVYQYNDKPKARAMIIAIMSELWENNIFSDVEDAFDINNAIGIQLDTLGKYMDLNRYYKDSLNATIAMTDDEFRFILRLRGIQRLNIHSMESIDDGLFKFFGTNLVILSNYNMSITTYITTTINIIKIAIQKKVIPKPLGVGNTIIIAGDQSKFLAFLSYNTININLTIGFSTYDNYNSVVAKIMNYNNYIV